MNIYRAKWGSAELIELQRQGVQTEGNQDKQAYLALLIG